MIKKNLIKNFIFSIHQAIGKKKVYLHEPILKGNELNYVKKCLSKNIISSIGSGPYVNKFEKMMEEYTKSRYCVSTINGTAALHVAMLLSDIKKIDEVLIPAFNFVAVANVIKYIGASIIFIDIEEKTMGVDPSKLKEFLKYNTYQRNKKCINKKTGRVIKSLILLHTFGHPADIEAIIKITKDYNIILVEDAAEAIGSKYYGIHVGTFGKFGIISFNGNKTISTGGGGMILTNSSELAKKAKHISSISKINHPWEYNHDQLGFNYRLPNINAALGCAQLEKIEYFIKKKRLLFKKYNKSFCDLKDQIKIFEEPKNCRSNYWLQVALIKDLNNDSKQSLLKECHKSKIYIRPAWKLLNTIKYLKGSKKLDLSCSKKLYSSIINLPSSAFL